MRLVSRASAAVLIAAIALTGCGGSDSDSNGSGDAAGSSTAELVHVDGTIAVEGDTISITPKDGGEARSFSMGPEVERAQLMALATSGEPARVTYRDGEDVAAAVVPAPKLGEGVEAYEGEVVSVSDTELVVSGDDGERTFDISGADAGAFDAAHLDDHREQGEPIRVYFRADAPEAGIAYEDA